MSKSAFLAKYREILTATYAWAQDAAKVDNFMEKVRVTITTDASPWNFNGATTTAAWRAIGGKGTPTRTQLRALAD